MKADLPTDLPGGIKLAVEARRQDPGREGRDGLAAAGRPWRQGRRVQQGLCRHVPGIVLRSAHIRATLDAQAATLQTIMNETKAPCWAPDKPSDGACKVK